jgi:GLPGLI family protein
MKKLLILLLVAPFAFAQDVNVKFDMHLNKKDDDYSLTKHYTLCQNSDFAIFQLDDINDISQFKHKDKVSFCPQKRDTMRLYKVKSNTLLALLYQEKVFKDFKNDMQIFNELVDLKCDYIKDKVKMFDWKILEEKDTVILNYHCKKATTKFRGREYIAYYTNEIANQGGPWKFDGLPGFILKIKSTDGYVLIEPTEIKWNNEKHVLANPFLNIKTVSFDEIVTTLSQREKKYWAGSNGVKPKPNPRVKFEIPDAIEYFGLKENSL